VHDGGTLQANYAIFEYMNSSGIYLQTTAMLDTSFPLTNCTFRNGASGGCLIYLNNSQTVTITWANFPENTWGGSYNVKKINNAGAVTFAQYTGAFSGAAFESDTYNRINWQALAPVENMTISYLSATNRIQLSWSYSQSFSRFRIYRAATPNGDFQPVGTATSTTWWEVLPGSKYFYRVTAEQD